MIRRSILSSFLSFVPLAALLPAQCGTVDTSLCDVPGIRGRVAASTLWDPDGSGPATPLVVFAGDFLLAGNLSVVDVVAYDPVTAEWIALPGLADSGSSVNIGRALAVLANGDLVLGGSMRLGGGGPGTGASLVRWTGSGWERLGGTTFFGGGVHAMLVEPNGDLVVAGDFQYVNTTIFGGIARWNGSTWSDFGTAFPPTSTVKALARMPNGDLVAAGTFLSAGGVPTQRIARWNGAAWSALGPGFNSAPDGLLALPNGDVVAVGLFTVASGQAGAPQNLARWDGNAWSSYPGSSTIMQVSRSLLRLSSGDLLVAGSLLSGLGGIVHRWNGTAWSIYPSATAGIEPKGDVWTMLQLPQGDVFAAGGLRGDEGHNVLGVLRSDGASWQGLASGLILTVNAVCLAPNGDILVGCDGGTGVWRRRNGTWSALVGIGFVDELELAPNGDLLAISGRTPYHWDGVSWHDLSPGVYWPCEDLLVEENGDVVCCGTFPGPGSATYGLARWDGSTWTPFAPGFVDLRTLVRMPNGDYVAASSTHVARWDGSQWIPLGSQVGGVRSLVLSPSGLLFAGGGFAVAGGNPANRVASWNGTSWQALGSGVPAVVEAMAFLPNGDLVAAGTFDAAGSSCWRWNGATWSVFGPSAWRELLDVLVTPSGSVLLCGRYDPRLGDALIEDVPIVRMVTSTCPATAVVNGSGCAGSSGLVTLQTNNLPWLGGTFHSTAAGLPQQGLVGIVIGHPSVPQPLSSVIPEGLPGCELSTTQDLLALTVPNGSPMQLSVPLPRQAVLIGMVLRQQVVAAEFDAFGTLMEATASNALEMTLGWF